MTAGHNVLRGSGPGQKDAFDDALAHVGCPDRRIDRLCITCCSPSQLFTSRRDYSTRSRSDPQPGWIIVSLALAQRTTSSHCNNTLNALGCHPIGLEITHQRAGGLSLAE